MMIILLTCFFNLLPLGDPGEISAWYRGKTNIAASKSNFLSLGLKMYVYTNTDNC